MRVFVAGATGALGRATLPALMAAGHEVFGLARTPEKLLLVAQMGAETVRGDILDAQTIRSRISDIRPEAIVNLATAIPLRLKIDPEDWKMNDRIRTEGNANLLAAAQEVGVRLFVQESVGYICMPRGAEWIDEDSPLSYHPFLRPTLQMETQVRSASVPGVLLRFCALMAADSWHTRQSVGALRQGMLPLIGEGEAYLSMIHAVDAAQAIVCTLAAPEAAAGRTFFVGDSQPAPMHEVFPYAARLLHAPTPKSVPPFLAKMAIGATTFNILTASYRISSSAIRNTLGFTPRYPTYRETWQQIAQEIGEQPVNLSGDLS